MTNAYTNEFPVFTCQQMRDFDQAAVHTLGIPSLILMENAARSLCDAFLAWSRTLELEGSATGRVLRVLFLCGKGNNGGDGFAMARRLASLFRFSCDVVGGAPSDRWSGDAETNRQILEKMTRIIPQIPLNLWYLNNEKDLEHLADSLQTADIIVDALLGTGATGAPREPYARIISMVNQAGKPVFAVDIPSGLNGDTGEVVTEAIRAKMTCTLAGKKTGLVTSGAASWVGALTVGDIGLSCEPPLPSPTIK